MKKVPMVTKDDIEQIATEIRYRLRAANIRPAEIDLYVLGEK
jgi:hypothetical protein